MSQDTVAIAKWLMSSRIELEEASRITGLPVQRLRNLRDRMTRWAGRVFLPPELDMVIAALGARQPLTFVQVGANDGKSGDPVHRHILRHAGRALLIEPQPWLIEDLRCNYSGFTGTLVIENIAIGPGGETLDLHVLRRALWDEYVARVGRHPSQIFSPDRAQVVGRIGRRLGLSPEEAEAAVETLAVPMEPLSDVIARHGFADVDVLQIDCEGWDFKVIRTLGACRPSVINFESFNLTAEDWQGFSSWSEAEGYGFIRGPMDTLAIRGFLHRVTL